MNQTPSQIIFGRSSEDVLEIRATLEQHGRFRKEMEGRVREALLAGKDREVVVSILLYLAHRVLIKDLTGEKG